MMKVETCEFIFYKKNLGMVFHGIDETVTIIGISNKMKKSIKSNPNSPYNSPVKKVLEDKHNNIDNNVEEEESDCFKVDNDNEYYDKLKIVTDTIRMNIKKFETFDLLQECILYVKSNPIKECNHRIWLVYEYLDDFLLGSSIVSINDINVQGLDVYYQQKLLEQRKRPMKLILRSPHSSTMFSLTQDDLQSPRQPSIQNNHISYQLFLTKYQHNCTYKLRSKVDSILKDYIECDWKTCKLKKENTLPQATIVSIYKYIESEMIKLELFNSKHKRGLFMPEELLDYHWDDIQKHIETLIFSRVSTYTKNQLWDIYKEDYNDINQMLSNNNTDGTSSNNSYVSEFIEIDLSLSAAAAASVAAANNKGIDSNSSSLTSINSSPSTVCKPTNTAISPPRKVMNTHYSPSSSKRNSTLLPTTVVTAKPVVIELSTDHSLFMKLAYLRFITLRNVGLTTDQDNSNSTSPSSSNCNSKAARLLARNEIWYLAMSELSLAMQLNTPTEILTKLVASIKLIHHALSAYLNENSSTSTKNHGNSCICCSCHHLHIMTTTHPIIEDVYHIDKDSLLANCTRKNIFISEQTSVGDNCNNIHSALNNEISEALKYPILLSVSNQLSKIKNNNNKIDKNTVRCSNSNNALDNKINSTTSSSLIVGTPVIENDSNSINDVAIVSDRISNEDDNEDEEEDPLNDSYSKDDNSTHPTLSADELIPAIIWVLIQANPQNLEYVLWICNEFRHPNLVKGEEAFCLAQLSSALEFCRTASFQSFDIDPDIYNSNLMRYNHTLKLLLACKQGDLSAVQKLLIPTTFNPLTEIADINGYSPDYKDCPLTATIRFNKLHIFLYLLSISDIDINNVVNLYIGMNQRISILMIAAQYHRFEMTLHLLRYGADRYYHDDSGLTALTIIKSNLINLQKEQQPQFPNTPTSTINKSNATNTHANHKSTTTTTTTTAVTTTTNNTTTIIENELLEIILQYDPMRYDLIIAIINNDEKIILSLLLQMKNINYLKNTNELGNNFEDLFDFELITPLIASIYCDDSSLSLRMLLNKDICIIDMNQTNELKQSVLIICIKLCIKKPCEDLLMKVAILLRYGINRDLIDQFNRNALSYCIEGIKEYEKTLKDLTSITNASYTVSPWDTNTNKNDLTISILSDIQFIDNQPTTIEQKEILLKKKINILKEVYTLLVIDPNITYDPNNKVSMISITNNNIDDNHKDAVLSESELGFSSKEYLDVLSFRKLPIYELAKQKRLLEVKAMLYQGVDINTVCPIKNYSALMASVYNSDVDMLYMLLDANSFYKLSSIYHHTNSIWYEGVMKYMEYLSWTTKRDIDYIKDLDVNSYNYSINKYHTIKYPKEEIKLDVNRVDKSGMHALHYAAQIGNPKIIGALLYAGGQRNVLNAKSHTPLDIANAHQHIEAIHILSYDPNIVSICLAAKHGDWSVMKALLVQGVSINSEKIHYSKLDPNAIQHDLYTPFIAASAYGQVDLIYKMIEIPEINLNQVNKLNQTGLMYCAVIGNEELILKLLHKGIDRWIVDHQNETAADWAKKHEKYSIYLLLKNDPNRLYIHDMIRQSDFDGVVAMLKQNVDPNQKRYSSALHYTCNTNMTNQSSNSSSTTSNAIRKGSKTYDSDPMASSITSKQQQSSSSTTTYIHGETPLMVAARYNRIEILALLLKCPTIDLNLTDSQRWTALHHAAFLNQEPAVLLLLKAGISRASRNSDLLTASSVAKNANHMQIGAIIDADPYSIFMHDVCYMGKLLLAIGLLKQGCPPNFRDERDDKKHQTPLMAASLGNRSEVVKYLLNIPEVVKNINLQDDQGCTALMLAASVGAMNITSLLITAGANRNLTDCKGLSAKDYASKHSYTAYFQFASQTMW